MRNLLVYGSLINTMESGKYHIKAGQLAPVKVRGYRRLFNQETKKRRGSGRQRAVLNVVEEPASWMNGILITEMADADARDIDRRESEYSLLEVPPAGITWYAQPHGDLASAVYLYTGKPSTSKPFASNQGQQETSLLPIPEYLHLCLAGAKQWGEAFYEDFLDTTFVQERLPLREFLHGADADIG